LRNRRTSSVKLTGLLAPLNRPFALCNLLSMLHRLLLSFVVMLSAACAQLPSSGPSAGVIAQANQQAANAIQVIDIDAAVARRLSSHRLRPLFSDVFGNSAMPAVAIGAGDTIEVHIWEAPPATLFGGGVTDPRSPSTTRSVTLPEQVVDREGFFSVPFVGRLRAAGRSTQEIEADIKRGLKGKANLPEVLVRVVRAPSATVTVVGEVANSLRMPLTPTGEKVLDALAAAGGVRQPVGKVTLQVSRGGTQQALPLETIIRDPRQNVTLQPGDVVTALFQPLSFTALGATGKNEEIPFEAQGISLAQALGRVGGVLDSRANAQGVFLFRLEPENALDWPRKPAIATPDGRVPVIYRLDLRDPTSFFVMQSFAIADKDLLYVSNAPAAELQKFLNLIFSVVYPVLTTISITQ
jgi:polysaccharide biosynthesis/export protein